MNNLTKTAQTTLRGNRKLPAKVKAVGEFVKVKRSVAEVKRKHGRPVYGSAISWPTRDNEVIPWTLCRPNNDGSISVFGDRVEGHDLNDQTVEQKRRYTGRESAHISPDPDMGVGGTDVLTAKKPRKRNGRSGGNRG